jgi:O-antigen/teichoic acid export membrane protein
MAARLAGVALTFAVPMVLARVLVPASYGTFKQAWLLSQTLALVLPMGLSMSLYYFVPRDPARRDLYVTQTQAAMAVIGLLAAGLLLLARPLVARGFENPELTRNLPWVAAFTGLTIAGAPLDVAWNASGRVVAAALARVGFDAVRAAAMIAGARLSGSVDGVLAGIAVATGLRAAASVAVVAIRSGLRFDLAALRRQAAYALPFGAAFLLIIPQQQWHQYAVAASVTTAAYAVYAVGTFQLPVVDVLYTPVSELLQIGLAEQEGAGRPPRAGLTLFHEAVLQLSFAFIPLLGLLLVIAPELIGLVFSSRYLAAVPLFRIGAIQAALAALPLDGVMRARAQNRFMLALSGGKLCATAALVWAGLSLAGPAGALAGFVLVEAVARVAMLARAARLFEVPLRQVLPARALLRQAVATAVAMPAAWLAARAVPDHASLRLLVAVPAFALAYLGLSWSRGWLPAGWTAILRLRRVRPAAASQ